MFSAGWLKNLNGKLICLVLAMIVCQISQAQVEMLDRAEQYILRNQLNNAQRALNIAQKYPSTANDARIFYLNALLCKELLAFTSDHRKDSLREVMMNDGLRCEQLDSSYIYVRKIAKLCHFALESLLNDGIIYFNQHKYRRSISLLNRYIQLRNAQEAESNEAHFYLGLAYMEMQMVSSAIPHLELLRSSHFNNPLIYIQLSKGYQIQNDHQSALISLTQGLAHYPDNRELKMEELRALLDAGDFYRLDAKLDEFMRRYKSDVKELLIAGRFYSKQYQRNSDAELDVKIRNTFKAVLAIEPDNSEAAYLLGNHYYRLGFSLFGDSAILDAEIPDEVLKESRLLLKEAHRLLWLAHRKDETNIEILKILQALCRRLNKKRDLIEVNTMLAKIEIKS